MLGGTDVPCALLMRCSRTCVHLIHKAACAAFCDSIRTQRATPPPQSSKHSLKISPSPAGLSRKLHTMRVQFTISSSSLIHFQTAKRHRGFLLRRQDSLHFIFPPLLRKNRKRAGRQGSRWTRGPRRLATSRHVEVHVSRHRFVCSGAPTASPPNPRRPARGVCRFAPAPSPVVDRSSRQRQPRDSPPNETQATHPALL